MCVDWNLLIFVTFKKMQKHYFVEIKLKKVLYINQNSNHLFIVRNSMYYKWTIVCNSVVGHKRASTKPSYKRKKKPWWVYCPPDSTQCSVGAKSLSMARWAKIINLRIGSCPRKRNALVLSPWRSEFYICNNVDSLGRKKMRLLFGGSSKKKELKV